MYYFINQALPAIAWQKGSGHSSMNMLTVSWVWYWFYLH